ncbi:hypothetical protein PInf_000421 [Phytophthora infestans]|nr:hypothetical protein PInf_000421 [Phytophthora infestans]
MATEMTTTEETETTETVTSEDVRALAREDVSGDVTRSVAERGFVEGTTTEMVTEMTTTEETETTETVTSEDVRALAREDVSGDVTRSVAERGFVEGTTTEMATEMTTTEETETTETVTSEDVRALAREDVSGDVTRSVAERGGYDVSSDCTSGAGTGSSKPTTETTEETETFCRGYHYGNGHRDDHDGGNGNDGDSDERGRESLGTRRRYHYGNGHRDDHDGENGNDRDNDERALAREDVSGDVTRSVAERGGYDVSSDCTSGAGTGSSKQTIETSEGTETFCRGYHYGNGHRDDHDGGNGNDGDTLAREDVSGDVTRSVAERGGYAVSSGGTSGAGTGSSKQTTETTEETETFVEGTTTEMATEMTTTEETITTETVTSEDVRALAREDVSGDVTRSVAERGGYDVSSDCTSGAGTGSSKQTIETSEETETFCRGYHYGNGHRDDHDGGNGNDGDTLAREDVSGDVTRSVAERGGYDVSSDCTSGAGTGSSKPTTETTEETETFCRGYHYGNGHRDDHDGGNGNDGDTLAREDVSGDVTRSVAERGFVEGTTTEMATEMTTTEETETTETVTSEDVRALAREDVSGDVTRSVAERGGYDVSSDCTSGAGTGSSKPTTETTEETETFCRGYHYGNGHRDDHDGGNGNDGDTLAREDVSGDVTRSVAERGFVEGTTTEMATEMTTTEETETTETVTSEDVRALAREDVSGDVTRSVAERGGYDVSSDCTSGAGTGSSKPTTETTEETETFCRGYHYGNGHRDDHDGGNGNDGDSDERGRESLGTRRREWRRYHYGNGHRDDHDGGNGNDRDNDERALAREDVSGDVTRRVAERGGYDVSSDCTSGAGTGSSKQTIETSEETETFCRGYHYGNGHRDDHDGGNGNDGDTLAREDVSGDVTRSVAERGFVEGTTTEMVTEMTTTEETETTETVTSEDVIALAREDVSGDVTRRVAERGGYDVSSDCTSGAGTGSSKQTIETSEETETFCRGYHYGNGHRDDHDGGNGNDGDTLAREDVSGDVTRSVAERGGYDVSSDCTSGAGTGSSKPTTETTEETETFCRGYHYGNGHRDDHDGGNGNDGDTLAREDVSGDVTRSVAERGGYDVSSDCTSGAGTGSSKPTTETTEETETFCRGYHYGNGHRDDHDGGNGNDGDTLAREDVSGDVTRSVAERGGYDVSSDCTSGAGTGSSKPTTETTEETETFCRGYHYGNGHRDDHDGGNGNDGDSDERGRESLGTRRREWRRYHYGNGHRDDHDGENGNDRDNDERALAREDVSGDVTRSVAERGGYDVSSDCTSGAGTGSSKPTTETTEETETFCRGYHYGNGHRDDHDGGSGNDGDTLAREDVSGDVTRSVAERGFVEGTTTEMVTEMTTTEETETTETVTSEDVRALAREDVSGDVTRSVAERGGYDVSSDCTSGAGTGSSKQTTETTEKTETFCRGYHYGNGHRDDHDGGNGNDGDTLAREDVSGDVTRSVAERGFVEGTTTEMATEMTTTEETETTETVTSEDVRALAREDVSGDVTRSVAERGGYDVSSDCTSGAGTGSSKQTTETTEKTETFCRGYHYGNGHRDDHDGGNGNDGDSDERGRESLGTRRREWRRDPQCG